MAWFRVLFVLVVLLVVLAALVLLAGRLGRLTGNVPQQLGVRDGKLQPPSRTPNSVSSQAGLWPDHPQAAYARIEPLPMRGDAAATLAALKKVLTALPGTQIKDERPDYLYATCTTAVLKFTDDLEFWVDPAANAVQVRSASRLGRKDLGVNRQRVEAIRAALARQ